MKLRPFFTYFGGKYRLAPKYPPPLFDIVVESFAGSAGYATRHHTKDVILCEKDREIAEMWRWLISARPSEVLDLPLLEGRIVPDLDVPAGARTLIGFWCNKATTHPGNRLSAWARKYPEQFWGREIRARVASQVDHIKHWRVEADYRMVNIEATYFVDPPYQGQGYRYRCNVIDYEHLRQWCESRSGQVIVCESAGADWGPFRPFADAKSTRGRSKEVLWYLTQ